MKTVVPKPTLEDQKWYLVDAEGKVLGRLASQIAHVLRGKHKPQFSPHLDGGDHVIVVNVEKIRITGRKLQSKQYEWYTGYPGGLRSRSVRQVFHDHPERVLHDAVEGMLPRNRLGRKLIRKLKIYTGAAHPHQAQKPESLPNLMRAV